MKHKLSSIVVFQCASFLFIAALFFGLRHECVEADAAKQICLASATPVLTFVRSIFAGSFFPWSLEGHYLYTFYGALAVLGLLLTCLIALRRCPWWGALYFIALGLCTYGEFMSVQMRPSAFGVFYCAGLVVALGAFSLIARKGEPLLGDAWLDPEARRAAPRWYEVGAFLAVLLPIAAARFYAVNQIPGHWDSEMCGHRPVIASWSLMIDQELGRFSQQSSGLSWLMAHRLFTRFDDPLYFFLDQRLLGAGISLLNCWLVYFFMRSLAGPFAAFMGLTLFAFGPVEIDWARGPTLHNLPVTLGILMLWWTFKAFQERTWRAFIVVALLIMASKHFYPSARLIAFGPCLGFLAVLLWHRKEWRGYKRRLLLIPLGCVGFVFFRSFLWWYSLGTYQWVFPFEKIQTVNGEGSLIGTLVSVAKDIPVLIREIFSIPHIVDHYTRHATLFPLHALPSLALIFVGIALVRVLCTARSPIALTWAGVLIGGVVPALLTGLADRRFGFTIVALPLLATMEISWFVNRMVAPRLPRVTPPLKTAFCSICAIGLCLPQSLVMFSRTPARPHQLNFVDAVRPFVTPGTVVIQLETDNPCPFFYGIYDILRKSEGSIGYIHLSRFPQDLDKTFEKVQVPADTWQYRNTALSSQTEVVRAKQDWSQVLFVFYVHPSTLVWQQRLKERYPNGSGREIPIPVANGETTGVYVFETPWER